MALSGVAHGVIDHIPTDGSFLLNKGEAVVINRNSKDIKAIMSNSKKARKRLKREDISFQFSKCRTKINVSLFSQCGYRDWGVIDLSQFPNGDISLKELERMVVNGADSISVSSD